MVWFSCIAISPFIILTIAGIPMIEPSVWLQTPPDISSVNWAIIISITCWNTSGFDQMGTIVKDLKKPETNFPKGIIMSLVLIVLTYVLPLFVLVCANQDYQHWEEGYFPTVAHAV